MTTLLISLVGHQPLPGLLAIRYLQPDRVLFLHSATQDIARRKGFLVDLLPPGCREMPADPVDPWDIRSIPQMLPEFLRRHRLDQATLVFDLTGGTKAMSIGLVQAAKMFPEKTLIYVESERSDSTLFRYHFVAGERPEDEHLVRDEGEVLPEMLTLEDFFYAYLGRFDTSPKSTAQKDEHGHMFEDDVARAFSELRKLQIKRSVRPVAAEEMDIVMRYRNRVAIVECKTGNSARKLDGVMQLSNLASDRYLGTYTGKILAVQANYREKPGNNMEVAERHDVFVLELPAWHEERRRDETGKLIWTSAELEEFKKALEYVFGPESRGQ